MWRMNISFSDGRTQEFDLPLGEIIVGRSVDCGMILEDKSISRQHAKITVRKVGVDIEDLQSSNGIIINGKQVADRILLQDGDEVALGTVKLRLKLCEDEERTILFEPIEEEQPAGEPAIKASTDGQAASPDADNQTTTQKAIPKSEKPEFELEEDTQVDPLQAGPASAKKSGPGGASEERARASQPDSPIAKLIIYPEGLPKETYQMTKDVINIGRSEENDIIIDHNSVSRFQAKIVTHGEDHFLLDLDSANGTKVNDHQISKHKLQHWDEIHFGSVLARFADKSKNETTAVKSSSRKKHSPQRSTPLRIIILIALLVMLLAVLLMNR